MHGVGRRDHVDAALQQLGAEHLVEALEPRLVLQEPQQPNADLGVVTELLDRDPQELRRAVDDDGAVLGAEHPQLEPVEQDAGAARVVDQDVAVAQGLGELLDGGVEVAVPAVGVDVVVGQAEVVDRLGGPRLVGDAGEALGPRERLTGPRRRRAAAW